MEEKILKYTGQMYLVPIYLFTPEDQAALNMIIKLARPSKA